ncbi:MAG TPA: hypothetical protein VEL03_10420, partial [Streptosporangiaceae bacterium]|nr:hypothetical protein [Streptosporangiaceae bacterium]
MALQTAESGVFPRLGADTARPRRDLQELTTGDDMSEHSHLSADLGHDEFEREVRGYSRRQVDETLAGLRLSMRTLEDGKHDLEDRLSQALDENERLKLELSAARSNGRPPHEEISERIGQILKLADDEAKSQRVKAEEEITKLRSDAQ